MTRRGESAAPSSTQNPLYGSSVTGTAISTTPASEE